MLKAYVLILYVWAAPFGQWVEAGSDVYLSREDCTEAAYIIERWTSDRAICSPVNLMYNIKITERES